MSDDFIYEYEVYVEFWNKKLFYSPNNNLYRILNNGEQ